MFKNIASQKVAVFAYDTNADAPKTGDAAQITGQYSLDGGATAAITDTNPTELDATDAPGIYIFDLAQAETNGNMNIYFAQSSTSAIQIDPVIVFTQVDVAYISQDSTAADNLELAFDGTGYAGGTIKPDVNVVTVGGSSPESQYAIDTTVATSNTTTSFTLTAGKAANDAYNDMIISVTDADDGNIESRRISDWTSGRVVTVETAFSFTPAVSDIVHISELVVATDTQSDCNDALVALNLDHLMKTAVVDNADMTTEVPDGTVLSNMMTTGGDTSSYTLGTDSLEGIKNGLFHERVIHVAPSGDDYDDGLSYATALVTIGQAITNATSGDTIKVWPGSYDEAVDGSALDGISLIGTGWQTILTNASGNTLAIGAEWNIKNIAIANTEADGASGYAALLIAGGDRQRIENVYISSTAIGISAFSSSTIDNILNRCVIRGQQFGVKLNGSMQIKNSYIKSIVSALPAGDVAAIWITGNQGKLKLDNCEIYGKRATTSSGSIARGIHAEAAVPIHAWKCMIEASETNAGGYLEAVRLESGTATAFLCECELRTTPYSTKTSSYDARAKTGDIIYLHGCKYDSSRTSGTVRLLASDGAGAGAIAFTYTLTNSVGGAAIAEADLWVTSDEAGTNVIASGTTDAAGQCVFYLDAGTVYVFRQKTGWNFTNPDTETVS